MTTTPTWTRERPRLLGLAYTVLGTWEDAEDAVSEAWLRLHRVTGTAQEPQDVPAWLTVVVSRLSLDAATTAAKRRETYTGPWLPEVVVADTADRVVLGEGVDLAFVRILQELRPVDRVILVLAEVADMSHQEIAGVVGSTPAATRQRLRRARATLAGPHGEETDPAPRLVDRATLDALATALDAGDLGSLVEQLSEGCVLWTDSGGLSRAARNPVYGADRVTRFLTGLVGKYGMPRVSVVHTVAGPALHAVSTDMTRVVSLELTGDGRIGGIQVQQNPGKIH
ncbi:sigma-70 family RNA polymerase sigma factor [Corynebacterium kalidii]|uniref:Sigma-70 family RNA polymerase sigma factor n=1 Tax=Corynebacterium kalidii TaxID=2931982 RepID=A0A9X1WGU0_9CORY|nr:sigma-70 family RNA polymerase sigma factor [Corynebacterium kalidii]MCJ7858859.1 sigma-70 family RNA polymerase sigma factor [Corynebacterium kalidii]